MKHNWSHNFCLETLFSQNNFYFVALSDIPFSIWKVQKSVSFSDVFVGRCFPNVCFPGFLTDWWNRTNDRWKSLNQFEVQLNIFKMILTEKNSFWFLFPWNISSKEYLRNIFLFSFFNFCLRNLTRFLWKNKIKRKF